MNMRNAEVFLLWMTGACLPTVFFNRKERRRVLKRDYLPEAFAAVGTAAGWLMALGGVFAGDTAENVWLCGLWCLSCIDLKERVIPNRLIILYSLLGLCAMLPKIGAEGAGSLRPGIFFWPVVLILLGLVVFWAKSSVGGGDIKLLLLGAVLTDRIKFMAEMIAAFTICMAAAAFIWASGGKKRGSAIPFSPFLLSAHLLMKFSSYVFKGLF